MKGLRGLKGLKGLKFKVGGMHNLYRRIEILAKIPKE
jgi:hypothetical protein